MVIMVIVHFCENLAGYTPLIAGVGAPLFMFLSGVSFRLWLHGQQKRNRSESEITKISIRRGLFLFVLGFVFNILVWSPEDAFNWDILTLIGTGLIVLSFARNLPPAVMLTFVVCLTLIAPITARMADWPAFWTDGYFDPDPTFSDVSLGFLATGYFPIIPWLALPILGFATATLIFPATLSPELSFNQKRAAAFSKTGLALITVALIMIGARYAVPSEWLNNLAKTWTMFPPSLEYLFAIFGFTLVAFVNLHRWIDQGSKDHGILQNLVGSFSKYSLSFYLLHHIVHLWPLWIYGVTYGSHPHDYWEKATSVPVALALAGAFIVASFIFFRFVDRYKWPTAESSMRWLCD